MNRFVNLSCLTGKEKCLVVVVCCFIVSLGLWCAMFLLVVVLAFFSCFFFVVLARFPYLPGEGC